MVICGSFGSRACAIRRWTRSPGAGAPAFLSSAARLDVTSFRTSSAWRATDCTNALIPRY